MCSGSVAIGTTISGGGLQYVDWGGSAIDTTISSGGSQYVYSGGVATGIKQKIGGNISVVISGGDSYTRVSGKNEKGSFSYSNGVANNFILYSGGSQNVYSGGVAIGTTIYSGGSQYVVGGSASGTTIYSGGIVTVRGTVTSATINNGGKLTLKHGEATALILKGGGSLIVSSGSTASMKSIASGGKLSLKAGGTLNLTSANVLYGKNSFTGAAVTGGTKDKRVSLAKKGTLTVGAKTNMKNLHLDASNANLSFTGTGNTLGSVKINKSTAVSYDVSKLAAKGTSYMLSLSTKNSQKLGSFSVNVKKGQGVGVYELSKNIAQAKNTAYTVNLAGKKQGVAKLNGLGLIKGTAIYTVNSKSNNISLTVAKTGKTLKARPRPTSSPAQTTGRCSTVARATTPLPVRTAETLQFMTRQPGARTQLLRHPAP